MEITDQEGGFLQKRLGDPVPSTTCLYTLPPSTRGFYDCHPHQHQAIERQNVEDRLYMGDLHGPELKVLPITSAHLHVVRAQLYTVAPDWEGGWEMESTCVPGEG